MLMLERVNCCPIQSPTSNILKWIKHEFLAHDQGNVYNSELLHWKTSRCHEKWMTLLKNVKLFPGDHLIGGSFNSKHCHQRRINFIYILLTALVFFSLTHSNFVFLFRRALLIYIISVSSLPRKDLTCWILLGDIRPLQKSNFWRTCCER